MTTVQLYQAHNFFDTSSVVWKQTLLDETSGLLPRVEFESGTLRLELRGPLGAEQGGAISGLVNTITLFNGATQVYQLVAPSVVPSVFADAGKLVDAILHGTYKAQLPGLVFEGEDHVMGSDGDDGIITLGGNDYISTAGGNDRVDAGAGDDRILDGGGSDRIDGGDGFDNVIWNGNLTGFKVERKAGGYTVTDLKTGEVGTVVGVERLEFGDKFVATDVAPDNVGGQLVRLYQAAFDRLPDQHGLLYWTDVAALGRTLEDIAGEFTKSAEYRQLYGADPASHDLVVKYYEHILHRAPDAAGLDYWTALLDSHAATRTQVLAAFGESPENVEGTAALIANGLVLDYMPFI